MPIVSLAGGGCGGVVVVVEEVVDMVGWIGGGWVSGLVGVWCVGWIYLSREGGREGDGCSDGEGSGIGDQR